MYVLDNIYICNDVYVYVHSHAFFIFHCNEHREFKLRLHTAYLPFASMLPRAGYGAAAHLKRHPFSSPVLSSNPFLMYFLTTSNSA